VVAHRTGKKLSSVLFFFFFFRLMTARYLALTVIAICVVTPPAVGERQMSLEAKGDRNALIALYDSTSGASWTSSSNPTRMWQITNISSDHCSWYGIACSSDGRVTGVALPSNGLTGTIPDALGNATQLRDLDVSINQLSGTLPRALALCTSMVIVYLHTNMLTGTIPSAFSSWGGKYVQFDVSNNKLSGSIPEELSKWDGFRFLASHNSLSGSLPASFSTWTRLIRFLVDSNQLSGTIPVSYGAWTSLRQFSANSNNLVGTISPLWSSWSSSMEAFSCSSNRLDGTLPRELGNWTSLKTFDVYNNALTGSLPSSYSRWSRLTYFRASLNPLTGSLPPQYRAWRSIQFILIYTTNISGTLPPEWGELSTLTTMLLFQNRVVGTLPASFGNLSKLTSLNVALNNLTGTLPIAAWSKLTSVTAMIVQNNPHLSGELNQSSSWYNMFAKSGGGGIFSICHTSICALAPLNVLPFGFPCIPDASISLLSSIGLNSLSLLFTIATWSHTSSCGAPVPTLTRTRTLLLTGPDDVNNRSSTDVNNRSSTMTLLDSSMTTASAAVSVTALTAGFLGGGGAGDLQMLSAVLSSPCMCGGSAGSISQRSASMSYSTSLFSQVGPVASVLGNIGLVIGFTILHRAAVLILKKRARRVVFGLDVVRPACTVQPCAEAKLRFPNISVRVALLLMPGILKASVVVLGAPSFTYTELSAACVGILSVIAVAVVLECFVYRYRILTIPLTFRRFSTKLDFAPVPPNVAAVLLPVGAWGPQQMAQQYNVLVGGLRGRRVAHLWRVMPCVNVVIQLLSALPTTTSSGCNALQSFVIMLALGAAIWWIVRRPARTLILGHTSAVLLIVIALLPTLGILCRYDIVTETAILTMALVASIVAIVNTSVSIAVSIAEQLLMRNVLASPSTVINPQSPGAQKGGAFINHIGTMSPPLSSSSHSAAASAMADETLRCSAPRKRTRTEERDPTTCSFVGARNLEELIHVICSQTQTEL
jgi:Leucine-rich repeat (LRR) protein